MPISLLYPHSVLFSTDSWVGRPGFGVSGRLLFMGQKIQIKYKGNVLTTVRITAKELRLSNKGIKSIRDIEGLDRLVNLRTLYLGENKITKIEGLDQLVNLEKLRLNYNQIAKIEGLDRLVKLKVLNLQENKITKIEGLDQLVKLVELDLYRNRITTIEGVDKLVSLKKLDLYENPLAGRSSWKADFEHCREMNLKAKEALKAKDFATSANLLNELITFCGAQKYQRPNIAPVCVIHDGFNNPLDWLVPLQTNQKILEKAKVASQDPAGLSWRKLMRLFEKWEYQTPDIYEIYRNFIPHELIPSKVKWRARIFALVGAICGFVVGWAGTSPLEGCLFAAIAGISMFLLVISMTSYDEWLRDDIMTVVVITASIGGMGWLIDTSSGGNGLAGLSLGLKVGLLLGMLHGLGCYLLAHYQHFGVLVSMAAGGGAGAGIGALIGSFLPAGAGYGASVGLLIGALVFYNVPYYTRSNPWLFFLIPCGIIMGFIGGAFSPVGVGMGAAWGLYFAFLARAFILLVSTSITYRQEKLGS